MIWLPKLISMIIIDDKHNKRQKFSCTWHSTNLLDAGKLRLIQFRKVFVASQYFSWQKKTLSNNFFPSHIQCKLYKVDSIYSKFCKIKLKSSLFVYLSLILIALLIEKKVHDKRRIAYNLCKFLLMCTVRYLTELKWKYESSTIASCIP